MGNAEQLAALRQGAEPWNAWRSEHPSLRPDLAGINLSGANLTAAGLSGADLNGANLRRADLTLANLHNAEPPMSAGS
jgi:uncharacterized protein YjbI with pentapeptide repeats